MTIQASRIGQRTARITLRLIVVLSAAVLAGCQTVGYNGVNTYVEKQSDGGYFITSIGMRGGSPQDVTKILVLRAAEFALKNEKPVIKMSQLDCRNKQRFDDTYRGAGPRKNHGFSTKCTALLHLLLLNDGRQLADQKVYAASDVIEEFKHLRTVE